MIKTNKQSKQCCRWYQRFGNTAAEQEVKMSESSWNQQPLLVTCLLILSEKLSSVYVKTPTDSQVSSPYSLFYYNLQVSGKNWTFMATTLILVMYDRSRFCEPVQDSMSTFLMILMRPMTKQQLWRYGCVDLRSRRKCRWGIDLHRETEKRDRH